MQRVSFYGNVNIITDLYLFWLQIAAFIAEPVMGAGGVILPPATYFGKVFFSSLMLQT
jgi:acetylornithine/succinyldiaminopimelate/putrescine aminotransferase